MAEIKKEVERRVGTQRQRNCNSSPILFSRHLRVAFVSVTSSLKNVSPSLVVAPLNFTLEYIF